jgi:Short C-terminal domain
MAFGKKKREKAQALFETGSRGVGEVIDVKDTGMTINDNPRVVLRFRIEPLDGSAPFEAEKKTTVSRVEIPRVGDRFPAWYDPADASSWAYATVNDDQGRTQIRQLFGAAAETMTGFGGGGAAMPAADPAERLRKLEELRAGGLINDEEFAAKKAELLASI